jgi:N-acetylglucosaminyl-diphospho-decaprenol L-rhamnosyltransferase
VTRLSVVVVTFNSREAAGRSLPALLAELLPADEVIVVDNASADGTADAVAALVPVATVIRNEHNRGFAAAANQGAEASTGDVVLLLNPDAIVQPGFREAICRPLEDGRGWHAWMGLVTMKAAMKAAMKGGMNGGTLVNTSGGVVHFTGVSWAGDAGRPVSEAPPGPREVAFASGACLAVRRDRWREQGGFSPEFFMYAEDADLSLRLRLAGGRVGIEPAARVDHDYEFAKGAAKWRHLERNRWAIVLRTYPAALLILVAPALVVTELALWLVALAGGWGLQKLLATADVVRALPRLLRERRAIQGQRDISTREFARVLTPDLSSEYLGRLAGSRPLRGALRAYWAVVRAALRLGP